MKLVAGQRFRLTDENKFVFIKSGFAEAYAMTRDIKSFRQLFLMELFANDTAYPSMDEFEKIDVVIYAVEDIEIELIDFKEVNSQAQAKLMRKWFAELIKLQWLGLMADRGDDMLISWRNGKIFSGKEDSNEEIYNEFLMNEQIFAMMLGVQFGAEDKRLSRRLETRKKHQQQLVDNAISNLMNDEQMHYETGAAGNENLEEVAFIVRRVANALSMPTENIQLSPEFVKRLDQLGLIRRLVQKGNMQIRFITLEKNWYKKDSGVIIGYYGKNKELSAFLPIAPDKYKLITRKNTQGILIDDEVAQNIDSDAFACYAGLPLKKLGITDLMKFMFKQGWKSDFRAIILASIVAGIIPLVIPIITESIFADIIPILDRKGLAIVTQVSIVTSFTMAAVSIVRSISVLRLTSKLDMSAEAALWGRLLALPTNFFRKFQSGELAKRMMGLNQVKQVVNEQFITLVFNFIFSFWSLILMAYYSLKLTMAAMLLWTVYSVIILFIYRNGFIFHKNMVEAQNKTAGLVQQIFAGLAKFRIQGAEEQAYYLWSEKFGDQWKWNLNIRWQNNYNNILMEIQPILLTMLIYYIAYYHLEPNSVGYAQFLAFQAAFTSFNLTFRQVLPLIDQFCRIRPQIDNLKPILEAEPEVAEDKIDAEVLTGNIEVRNLTFSYVEGGRNILNDVSFKIAAGENVAIVGGSGCGKSTLLRLLLGFEKPKSGAVYYDGQDLSELNVSSVRSQMGVVLQNGQLMSGDLFVNIVGTSALTIDDAWRAAESAGIADDIRNMPMGMQTVISEGSTNISGGQRQRILIARALAANPSIMIFDEATSALDNKTQAIVTESLNKLHTTRIVVAHRLSTIKECDRVIVLDKGQIAESGTFDELVEKGGLFANLVKRQVA